MHKIFTFLNHLRLALFPIAYALSGVLIGSTLNRVMIADLGFSASLTALFFALPLMVSPVRVWIGYRSDSFPLFGKRREPYIMLGALVIGLGAFGIARLITLGSSPLLLVGVALAFLVYGLGRNVGHNTFQALVAERFEGENRSRAATLYEVATMVGMVMGAGLIKSALKVYDPEKLVTVALGVALAVLLLAVLGAVGQEKRAPAVLAAEKARRANFPEAFRKVVLADPQVRLFFGIVILTFIGTLAQDVLLEPFGGLALGMPVGETTGLTQFWGVGVLLSMLASGLFLLKALGHLRVMRAGMLLSVLAFSGPIIAGATGNVGLFQTAVFVMGLGTGLAGAGMLSGTLAFTTRLRAGMLVGVWGVANMVGHAGGSLLGGVIVDTVRLLTGSALAAYSAVFGLEMAILLAAFSLSLRLNVDQSAAHVEEQQVLAAAD
jgi:BCD family chlorophyll transporter-like MFS transporter